MVSHDILEIGQVIALYPRSFVLVDNCKFGRGSILTHGRVVCVSTEQDVVYEALRVHSNSMIIYTGPTSEESEGAYLDRGHVWEEAVGAPEV